MCDMYHPNAYLPNIKDLKPGIKSRSKLLTFLKKRPRPTRKIAEGTELTYGNTLYHLRLMEKCGVVKRDKSKKTHIWYQTSSGQQSLNNIL
jgi:predicted transcriptional regulator